MSKHIDVDKFCEKVEKISDSAYSDSPVTRMSINLVLKWMKEFAYGRENAYGERIPPVPYAIDIVRCKDCIYRNKHGECENNCGYYIDPEFFCADGDDGKRKEIK